MKLTMRSLRLTWVMFSLMGAESVTLSVKGNVISS